MCIWYEYITNIFDLSSRGLTLAFGSMCCHYAVAPIHVVTSRMHVFAKCGIYRWLVFSKTWWQELCCDYINRRTAKIVKEKTTRRLWRGKPGSKLAWPLQQEQYNTERQNLMRKIQGLRWAKTQASLASCIYLYVDQITDYCPVCLAYKPYFFSQRTIFFSHNKSANSTFSHGLSTKQTGHTFG